MKVLRQALSFLLIFALAVGIFVLPKMGVAEAHGKSPLLKMGKKNDPVRVKDVQNRLSQVGLYNKAVTGMYDSYTRDVVLRFQKQHRLYWIDGIVGPETMGRLKKLTQKKSGKRTTAKFKLTEQDLRLLARAVYSEARGESFKGQVAVAAVVLNRVEHKAFPHTVRGVIYQPGAFTAVDDGQINLKPDQTAYEAAKQAAAGVDPTYGAIYYFNPKTASSKWMRNRALTSKTVKIGNHVFMR
jgi:N-acetylmuramoyl-L-alanine amidase